MLKRRGVVRIFEGTVLDLGLLGKLPDQKPLYNLLMSVRHVNRTCQPKLTVVDDRSTTPDKVFNRFKAAICTRSHCSGEDVSR